MPPQKIKISVIIRAYNSGKFIKEAIDSVLNQTINQNFYEIVVIDDGSTDNTGGALKPYKNQIRLIKLKHLGNVKALNRGIVEAKGRYLIILDADDLFLPDILEKMLSLFKKKKNIDFIYCDYYEKDIKNGRKKKVSLKSNIFNSIAGGIMFKKKMLEKLGMYNQKLIFPEYDILIKAKKKYKGFYLPQPLFVYRRHKNSITANKEKVELGKRQLFSKYGQIKGLKKY